MIEYTDVRSSSKFRWTFSRMPSGIYVWLATRDFRAVPHFNSMTVNGVLQQIKEMCGMDVPEEV